MQEEHYVIRLTSRQWFFANLVGIAAILLAAAYFQFHLNYQPCVLCEMQRLVFLAEVIVFGIAVIHHPHKLGIRIYGSIAVVLALLGCILAGRQVWLQALPQSQIPSCGPGLNFIFTHLPPEDILRQIFYGTADCAKTDWSFLHLSFAGWALVFFSLSGILALWQAIVPRRR